MNIKRMCLGEYQTNAYIVSAPPESECMIIDPADSGDLIARYILDCGLTPKAILLTHGHYDHILGIPELISIWPKLPIYCHAADCPAEVTEYDMGKIYPTVTAFAPILNYHENIVLSVGDINIKVLYTPGHTKGSVLLQAGDALFTGDTLFTGSAGRTDLPGGNSTELMASLRIIAGLDENLKIYPGHGPTSTLKQELTNNMYIKYALRAHI